MWVIELNVLGRRFTHRTSDQLSGWRLTPQNVQMRLSQLRRPRAAAKPVLQIATDSDPPRHRGQSARRRPQLPERSSIS